MILNRCGTDINTTKTDLPPNMEALRHKYVSSGNYVDPHPLRMTSPTCEDLGIPTNTGPDLEAMYSVLPERVILNPGLHLDGLRYATRMQTSSRPYTTLCRIPLPGALALHAATEPSFIRKRNERERERVRCVNEGYVRLKNHLPNGATEKRLSKVDTLRGAIDYIRHLQALLDENPPPPKGDRPDENTGDREGRTKLVVGLTSLDTQGNWCQQQTDDDERRKKTRRGSLCSEQSNLSDNTMSDGEGD